MLSSLAFAATLAMAPASTKQEPIDCSYGLETMLALDLNEFDQARDGGWRSLASKGCDLEAAELIRTWRHAKRDNTGILYWHEAQMRAFAGQTAEAIDLMQLTYAPPEFDEDFGWNYYVSGSIAFLLRNREHLRTMIEKLKAVPAPSDASFATQTGKAREIDWPPNLNVLEAFDRCWEKSYSEAYGSQECYPTAEKIES